MAKILRRYQSAIYGNYRKAYLRYGFLTGVVLALSMLFYRLVSPSNPPVSPNNYFIDAILAVAIFGGTFIYRKSLPDQKVMLKELLLLGTGMGMTASAVYGILLWPICGSLFPDMVDTFIANRLDLIKAQGESPETLEAIVQTRAYTAGDWAFIGAFRTFVFSIILTFFSSIIFRTEKSPLKQ